MMGEQKMPKEYGKLFKLAFLSFSIFLILKLLILSERII